MLAVCVVGPVVMAGPSTAAGAVHINNRGCALYDGDGEFVLASADRTLVTKNFATLVCKVRGVSNSSGVAVFYDKSNTGVRCGIDRGYDLVLTRNWSEVVSASGNATLRCTYRAA